MSGPGDLPAPVAAMVEATNEGDTARFLEAFAPDAVLDDWGRVFTGRDRIAEWNANENIGVTTRFAVTGADVAPGHVTLRLVVTGGGYNGPGTFEIDVDDEHVTSMTIR